jgi:hypothetical protein
MRPEHKTIQQRILAAGGHFEAAGEPFRGYGPLPEKTTGLFHDGPPSRNRRNVMFCLSKKNLYATALCVGVVGVLLTVGRIPACAQETDRGVVRTFAVFVNSPLELPDFSSDSSLGLLISQRERVIDPSFMYFAEDDYLDHPYEGTFWEQRNATHITKNGCVTLGVWWLLDKELPPTGSITFTGPDSPLILDEEFFNVEVYGGSLWVLDYGTGDGIFYVVTAVFSR